VQALPHLSLAIRALPGDDPKPAAKRGFIWLRFSCWHTGSRGCLQRIGKSTQGKHNFHDSWSDTKRSPRRALKN
jgi:hypothetical protein